MTAATSITVRVPLAICPRGGRKLVVTPDGSAPGVGPTRTRADPALVKALARAHRWKRLLEEGRYGSLGELAAAEKIDRSYVGKMLKLTLLAPDTVEALLNGPQSADPRLPALLEPFPAEWDRQRALLQGQRQRLLDRAVHGSSGCGHCHLPPRAHTPEEEASPRE